MNLKKRILLFSCFVMTMSCCSVYGMGDIVDVVICLESYHGGKSQELAIFRNSKDLMPIASDLIEALRQRVGVVVASAPLMLILKDFIDGGVQERRGIIREWKRIAKILDPKSQDSKDREGAKEAEEIIEANRVYIRMLKYDAFKNYKIYRTQDSNFGIFVYQGKTLKDCELNENLPSVIHAELTDVFEQPEKPEEINLESLKSIFKDSDVIKKKIIYLTGHGAFGKRGRVAQLTIEQYVDFIDVFLPTINCKFLFVSSCYGYGLKTEIIFERLAEFQRKAYEEAEIKLPIAVGAISDSVSKAYTDINFRGFFDGLHDLFVRRQAAKSKTWISRRPFEDSLRFVAGPILENTVLIRFPGLRQFFRPVNVDNRVLAITYPFLLAHELESVRGLEVAKETSVARGSKEEMKLISRTPEELRALEKAKTRALKKERQFRMEMKKVSKELKEKLKLEGRSSQERRHLEKLLTQKIKRELRERRVSITEIEAKIGKMEKRLGFRPIALRKKLSKAIQKKDKIEKGKIILATLPIRVENRTAILLYPTILIPTLEIVGTDIPALVSMFPGHAHHFIKKIEANNISFNDLIKGFFSKLRIKSKKLFLIGEIVCQDKTVADVVIETRYDDSDDNNKRVIIEVKFTENNDQKQVTYNGDIDTFDAEAPSNYNVDDVFNLLESISISKEAYMEATGGIENSRTFLNALKNHFLLLKRVSKGKMPEWRRERKIEYFRSHKERELQNRKKRLEEELLSLSSERLFFDRPVFGPVPVDEVKMNKIEKIKRRMTKKQEEIKKIERALQRMQRTGLGPERVAGTVVAVPKPTEIVVKDKQGQDIVCLLPKKTGRRLVSRMYKGAKVGYIEVAPGKRYVVKLYKRDFPKYKSRRIKYGIAQEVKIDDAFTVKTQDGKEIKCHIDRGKVSKKEIDLSDIELNDTVEIEIFPGEPTSGRIIRKIEEEEGEG